MQPRRRDALLPQYPVPDQTSQPRRSERLRSDKQLLNLQEPIPTSSVNSFPALSQGQIARSIDMADSIAPHVSIHVPKSHLVHEVPNSTPLPIKSFVTHDYNRLLHIDLAWEMARASFSANDYHVVLNLQVCQVIGMNGIEELKRRLSVAMGGAPIIVQKDGTTGNVRIMKHPGNPQTSFLASNEQERINTTNNGTKSGIHISTPHLPARSFGKKSKIPRPPNAFILYRQHWHAHYKHQHPSMHNNDISKEIGKRWKYETEVVKAKYRKLAADLKESHALKNPGYHYTPRKPGEKKRRMTAKKLAKIEEPQPHIENGHSTSSISQMGNISSSRARTELDDLDDVYQYTTPSSQDSIDSPYSSIPLECEQERRKCHVSLPIPYAEVQREVQESVEKDCLKYPFAVEDTNMFEAPEQYLLYAKPGSDILDLQAGWESLIDWQSVNQSVVPADQQFTATVDSIQETSTGPESAVSFVDIVGLGSAAK